MNDHQNPRWPQDPDNGRHSQWPTGDSDGPQWPSEEPSSPPPWQRQSRPERPRRPQQGGQPGRPMDGPQGRPPQGRPPQDRPPQGGRPPQGRAPQDRTPQGRPPQDRQGPPQGRPPQGRPPQDRSPQGRPPQDRSRQNRAGAVGGAAAGGAAAGAAGAAAAGRARGGRRPESEYSTGLIRPELGEGEREPGLLTHDRLSTGYDDHYDPYDEQGFSSAAAGGERGYADEDHESHEYGGDPERPGKKGKSALTAAERKKRRWKFVRRGIYTFVGVFLVLPAIAFTVAYFIVDVPTSEEVAQQQGKVVTYLYADGSEMGKEVPSGGDGNRVLLKPNEIPDVVKKAVYAAEDATFETNSGFDIKGILGAVWNQVSGGSGGGSTISQQYIKKATGNEDATITRKFTEVVKSFKMNQTQEKQDIITAYLNTIYFGRGANGIQTAAKAYFDKDAKDLNASEGAYLAGLIQLPGRSENEKYTDYRWGYVMEQLVANKWLSPAEKAAATKPQTIPREQAKLQSITGPGALIQARVKDELEAAGYPEEKIFAGGYKVHTTIDSKAQKAAEESVNEVMKGQPDELKESLVAVDPKTGGIRAYYGGPGVLPNGKRDVDWANYQREPGSSYKPFDLVALLQKGKGIYEEYDGSSPRKIQGATVTNSGGSDCNPCTVAEAMEKSVNTVFYDMVANDTSPKGVVEAAKQAGIPEAHGETQTMKDADNNVSIGGGSTLVTTEDMAGAYATFAADGTRRPQHFVSKITEADDTVIKDFNAETEAKPAFAEGDAEKSKQIAGNVTKSLQPVLPHSSLTCADGRECAGKTGTHQFVGEGGAKSEDNAQAWMVGYTPSMSAASWVGTGGNNKIRDADGAKIFGKDLPGEIWKKFMDKSLEGTPKEKFADVKTIGRTEPKPAPSTKKPEPTTQAPPPTPTQPPEPTTPPTSTGPPSTDTGEPDDDPFPGGTPTGDKPDPGKPDFPWDQNKPENNQP